MPGGQKGNVALEKKMRKQQGESQPLPSSDVARVLGIFPISPTRKDEEPFTHRSYNEEAAGSTVWPVGIYVPKSFWRMGLP